MKHPFKRFISGFVVAALLGVLSPTPTLAQIVFQDVSSSHPYYEAINYLSEKGVIQGYEDNTFRPEKTINRAETLKIILLGSNILVPEIQDQTIFPDVLYGTWYAKYVLKAKNLGIVSGDSDTGFFRPGDNVNLAEILKILLKANSTTLTTPTQNPYADVPYDAWFSPFFLYAKKVGLLDAKSSQNVYPAQAVTRGLMAELMYRLATKPLAQADGKASYYGGDFHGLTTASGEVFDASAFTAAHLTYAFGTYLKVTNLENGKAVVVKINDRGPYGNAERIIDLSQAAFESISPLSRGIIPVTLVETTEPAGPVTVAPVPEPVPVPAPVSSCAPETQLKYIAKDTYKNIQLDSEIPSQIFVNQALLIQGKSLSTNPKVTVFWVDSNGKQTTTYGTLVQGAFSVPVSLSTPGNYQLGILPGESGAAVVEDMEVLPISCLSETAGISPSPADFKIGLTNRETRFSWTSSSYNVFKITLKQGTQSKSFFLPSFNQWTPIYREFKNFSTGLVSVSLQGGTLTTKSLAESKAVEWSKPASFSFTAQEHFEAIIDAEQVSIKTLSSSVAQGGTLEATFTPKIAVREKAALILPSGQVAEVNLTSTTDQAFKDANDVLIFPASSSTLTLSYPAATSGLYFIEINNAEGLAAVNVPVYPKGGYPLIPTVTDLVDPTSIDLGTDLNKLRITFLSLVNADRAKYGLPPVELDANINKLAQFRSNDMVANHYFSHWDSAGRSANDIRVNYGIQPFVSENLAKDVNMESAQYGLMRSAIHRSNILKPDWTRVGFGITKDNDGTYVFVQLFSTDPINITDVSEIRQDIQKVINDQRGTGLILDDTLNGLAQDWSDKMVTEDFFDFVDNTGGSLIDNIRAAGIKVALGTYLVGNSNFQSALDQIEGNEQALEAHFKKLGVGIKQDPAGIIKITLIYTD